MGILGWFRGRDAAPAESSEEQAVLVRIPLSDDEFGTEGERAAIHGLSDLIVEVVEGAGVGEFDGDEFGGGECTLYMYGPDADQLWGAIEELVRRSSLVRGGHAVKRYGGPGPGTRSERIDL